MLRDDDDQKWSYHDHTAGKHAILIRYMKAWLPILGRYSERLVIVDAFAGRGRYASEEPGSPLRLRDIAGRVISDRRVREVRLFYIERNRSNWEKLTGVLASIKTPPGVVENSPIHGTFERSAPAIVQSVRGSRWPSFWVVDPNGFAGFPLSLINATLGPLRSEVLITLMVRDIGRFLDQPNHQQADAALFGLRGDELLGAIERVKAVPNRAQALRDLYVERLEATVPAGGRRFVTSVGVADRGASDIVYYLVHVTGHPKGKREMKKAITAATGGLNSVVGARLAMEAAGQHGLFSDADMRSTVVDPAALKRLLQERFTGRREIEYDALQDEAVVGHDFDAAIDQEIKKALDELADAGIIKRFRKGQPSIRKLAQGDTLDFPTQEESDSYRRA